MSESQTIQKCLSEQLAQFIEQKNTISNELEKICNEMNILTLKQQTDSSSDVKKEYDELTEKCFRLVTQKQIITTKMLEVSIQLKSNTNVLQVDTKISKEEDICDDGYEYIYVNKREELEKQHQFLEYQERMRQARYLERQKECDERYQERELGRKIQYQLEQQKQLEQEKIADERIRKENEEYQKKLVEEIKEDIAEQSKEVSESESSDDGSSDNEMKRDDEIKIVKDDIIKLVLLSMKIFTNISKFDDKNIKKIRHSIEKNIGILDE